MEMIKSAFQTLKNGTDKSKNKAVEEAIDKLAAVLDILKQDTLANDTRLALSNLLRRSIQPLYQHELSLALNFSSAVLLGLYNAKVLKSEGTPGRMAWEMDHLDNHRTGKIRAQIGQAFYTCLCRLYISTQPNEPINASSDLLTTVFMLLSEIVSGQAANATAFRKELVGGRRLGVTIYNIRDFLPLEASLELFANILLTFRTANARERTKYVQEVFNPELFPNSAQFVERLSKVTNSRLWDEASSDVLKLVSSLDISFPQSFAMSDFQLKGLQAEKMNEIWLETTAFLSSVPAPGGATDTVIIPFRTITSLTLAPANPRIVVNLRVNAPPTVGHDPVKCGQGDITITWQFEKQELNHFVKCLKRRKVPFESSNLEHNRKSSIAKAEITLDISAELQPPKATQEKVIAIAKLWDGSDANRGAADCNPTSPMLHSIFPPNSGEMTRDKSMPPPPVPSQTVFIDREGNLTDQPSKLLEKTTVPATGAERSAGDVVKSKAPTNNILFSKAMSVLLSANKPTTTQESEVENPQPKTSTRRLRTNVIVSEDDESDLTDIDRFEMLSPTPPTRRSGLRSATSHTKPEGGEESKIPAPAARAVIEPVETPIPDALKSIEPPMKRQGPENSVSEKPHRSEEALNRKERAEKTKPGSAAPTPRAPDKKKRLAPEPSSDDAPPAPPSKKARTSPEKKHRSATRYKSKLRGSTPAAPINLDDSDGDDEPPKAPKSAVAKKEVESTRKKAAMKDKNGKATKPKPVPAFRRKAAANATKKQDTPALKLVDVKPNVRALEKVTAGFNAQEMKTQATAKESRPVKLEAATPHLHKAKMEEQKTKSSSKPKQAVWQRDSFMMKAQNESTPLKAALQDGVESEPEAVWDEASENAFQFEPEQQQNQPHDTAIESSGVSAESGGSETFVTEPPLAEYWAPTKGSVESPVSEDPVVVKEEQEDAVMIDLTMSPSPPPQAPRAITPGVVVKDTLKTPVYMAEAKPIVSSVPAKVPLPPAPAKKPKEEDPTSRRPEKIPATQNRQRSTSWLPESSKKPTVYRGDQQYILRLPHIKPPAEPWSDARNRAQYPDKTFTVRKISISKYERVPPNSRRLALPNKTKDDIESIPEVITNIGRALSDKILRKFEEASQGMMNAQLDILRGAAEALEPMHDEAIEHFNAIVDLEEEYASHRRKIMTAIDAFKKSADETAASSKQVAINHNRFGLAKKFPPSLFSKPIPTVEIKF